MIRRLLSTLLFSSCNCILGHSQPQLQVTSLGIAPITMIIDSVQTNDIYSGALGVVEAYCAGQCSITSEENKSIKVEALQQMAFTAMKGPMPLSYDIKFTLIIMISNKQMNIEYRAGAIYPHGQSKLAEFTYVDFFKKDGTVKSNYSESKQGLENTINTLPFGIYRHLKKNYVPKLVVDDFEKGYVKGQVKYSVWQYFDSNKQLELTVNHTTGKVIYQRPDSGAYFAVTHGSLEKARLDIRPMPVTGSRNFYTAVRGAFSNVALFYRCKNFNGGKVVVVFDVDTLGNLKNWNLIQGTGLVSCDSMMLACLGKLKTKWIPAQRVNEKITTRLAIPLIVKIEDKDGSSSTPEAHQVAAKFLDQLEVTIPKVDDRVFNFVEQSAEFIGGLEALSKWLARNLRYPASARRMGLEGKVTIKCIIERNGEISNVEVVRGFDAACDAEAIRVISSMPKWKPGMQLGVAVRQAYVLPVTFKLNE